MAAYSITLDLPTQGDIQQVVLGTAYPLLGQAVRAIAQEAEMRWKHAINQARLWDGEKKAYINSIKVNYLSGLSAEVVSDYKYADEIENGRPPRDLKDMLQTSTKVRVNKKGKRYLIIPFRHNTPGNTAHAPDMPPDVYALAKDMAPSKVTGMTTRQSGQKGMRHVSVPQAIYKWGDRLPAGLAPKLRSTHKTDPYAGMYRFTTSTPNQQSSTYLTFRTMVEGSPGWIVPAKPGLYLARNVAEQLQPAATKAIETAMQWSVNQITG
ncbi:hypothetical protein [Burkholderia anthina]|uniref:hypothetical protein n=1 Tax=Burkholderia anthina TaxID=179879 RepID=UPI00158BD4E7|nr:hypothetical protein [Burkholderia anthina]